MFEVYDVFYSFNIMFNTLSTHFLHPTVYSCIDGSLFRLLMGKKNVWENMNIKHFIARCVDVNVKAN